MGAAFGLRIAAFSVCLGVGSAALPAERQKPRSAAAPKASASRAASSPAAATEEYTTPRLQTKTFDAIAVSKRTEPPPWRDGHPRGFTLENAVCNLSNDPARTLVFDWPEAGFFSAEGDPAPPGKCKVLTRTGIPATEVDDRSNVLLTTHKTPEAATTFRRARDKTDKVCDGIATLVGMRPITPGKAAAGVDVNVATYFNGTKAEHVIEGSRPELVVYVALPHLDEKALADLDEQLRAQGQAKRGSRVATRAELEQDFKSGADRERFAAFMGPPATHVAKLVQFQKVVLAWQTSSRAGNAVRWLEVPVIVASKDAVDTGFTYATPTPSE